jgi:DNA-binding MarR family transcriptional regulator
MVNRLEAAGFVARADDANDRRIKLLSLTEHGRDIMDCRRQRRISQAEAALAKLSATARRQLIQSLELLVVQGRRGDDECELTVVAELEHRLPPLADPNS